MKSHANRPGCVFYSINRRYRVQAKLGVYIVQRRRQDEDRTRWSNFSPATASRDHAIGICSLMGAEAFYSPGIGWL